MLLIRRLIGLRVFGEIIASLADYMGSIITLDIEGLRVDWAKNDYTDHSPLFLPTDVTVLPYYYADNVIEVQEGLSKTTWQGQKAVGFARLSPASAREKIRRTVDGYFR